MLIKRKTAKPILEEITQALGYDRSYGYQMALKLIKKRRKELQKNQANEFEASEALVAETGTWFSPKNTLLLRNENQLKRFLKSAIPPHRHFGVQSIPGDATWPEFASQAEGPYLLTDMLKLINSPYLSEDTIKRAALSERERGTDPAKTLGVYRNSKGGWVVSMPVFYQKFVRIYDK